MRTLRVTLVPAVLGQDPWTTPEEAFLLATGRRERAVTRAMEMGKRLEPLIVQMVGEHVGAPIEDLAVPISDGVLRGEIDAVLSDGTVVEAKTSQQYFEEPPPHWRIQLLCYCAMKQSRGILAILTRGVHLELFRVEVDPEWWKRVRAAVNRFVEEHLARDVPPGREWLEYLESEGWIERSRVLEARVFPPGLEEIVEMYLRLKEERDRVEEQLQVLREVFSEYIVEDGVYSDGIYRIRRATVERTRVDVERLSRERPDVVAEYMTRSRHVRYQVERIARPEEW